MGDFFKQLLTQTSDVWRKLSVQQQIIIAALTILMFVGLLWLAIWNGASGGSSGSAGNGYKKLFSNLPIEELANVTDALSQAGFKYKISNNGTSVDVEEKSYYEAKMALAREGLPANRGVGWELFDSKNFGDTDFELKLKARRALEGELTRTIKSIGEVEDARVHLTLPEESLFLEEKKPAKAAIAVKIRANRTLNREQINGIAYLAASSVDGLAINSISIVDFQGRVLSRPADENDAALIGSRNMEMRQDVEKNLEKKVISLFEQVLGSGKVSVKITADLDFNRVESTLEKYNPESRVARSEERNETSVTNAPDGDRTNERSLANYEIDKTVEHIIHEIGTIKRLTAAVMVDGRYSRGEKGARIYSPRTPEEITSFETMVKNAVGYDLTRGDQVSVINVQFDDESRMFFEHETELSKKDEFWRRIINYVALVLIAIIAFIILRSVAKTLGEAMNPPIPEVEIPNINSEEEVVEVPLNVSRSNELLEKVEIMTENDPQSVVRIITDWLNEPITKKD
ncbi:MAG: flagellar M-ring protein FliF [Chitinispirillales bacterium]|jgi:flagellar M-ring protein FliF|nr:flagellar M-ring protein FliF [Chitinispirillales bacterium]